MKRNFLGLMAGVAAIAATAVVAVSSVNANSTQSDLMTKNLEALTTYEDSNKHSYSCWVGTKGTSESGGTAKTYCGDCESHYSSSVTGDGHCYK